MRWLALIVASVLLMGLAGWLVLTPGGGSGDSIPWRGHNHFSLHTP